MLRLGEHIEHLYPSITVYTADINLCHISAYKFLVIAVPILFTLRGRQILFHYYHGNLRIMLTNFDKYEARSIHNSGLVKVPQRATLSRPVLPNGGFVSYDEFMIERSKLTPHGCPNPKQCDDDLCQILMEIDGWTEEPAKDWKVSIPTNKVGLSSATAQTLRDLGSKVLISDHDPTSTIPVEDEFSWTY